MNTIDTVLARDFGHLSGKTVKALRSLTKAERSHLFADDWAWDRPDVLLLEFTDGSGVIVSQDPEGNGPGWLFTVEPSDIDHYGEDTE